MEYHQFCMFWISGVLHFWCNKRDVFSSTLTLFIIICRFWNKNLKRINHTCARTWNWQLPKEIKFVLFFRNCNGTTSFVIGNRTFKKTIQRKKGFMLDWLCVCGNYILFHSKKSYIFSCSESAENCDSCKCKFFFIKNMF